MAKHSVINAMTRPMINYETMTNSNNNSAYAFGIRAAANIANKAINGETIAIVDGVGFY